MTSRILFLDLETSPNLAHVWGLWQQNVGLNQLAKSTEVICYGAQWLGERKVHFQSVHHDGKQAMLEGIHALLDEADIVVGWNSKNFDSKHLRRELLEAGMLPPSDFKDVDLMQQVKASFRFPSNKLDYVAQALGVGNKVKHSGFDLWLGCMSGDEKAWREMKRYQIQDVRLLDELWKKLLPWLKLPMPLDDSLDSCRNCGSHDLQRRGWERKASFKYQRYQCQGCGKWQTSNEGVRITATR